MCEVFPHFFSDVGPIFSPVFLELILNKTTVLAVEIFLNSFVLGGSPTIFVESQSVNEFVFAGRVDLAHLDCVGFARAILARSTLQHYKV